MNSTAHVLPNNLLVAPYLNNTEYADIILLHWYKFAEPESVYFYLLGACATIIGLSAIAANSLIIIAYISTKSLRSSCNWFTINLAISDIGLSITCCFPMKAVAMFQRKWIWGKVGCDFYGVSGGLFGFASIATLATIAYLRYNTIAQVQTWSNTVTRRKAIFALLAIWLWSATWPMLPYFGLGRWVLEGFLTGCTFDYISNDRSSRVFSLCLFFGGFICPVLLICFSYARIIWLIRASKRHLCQSTPRDGTDTQEIPCKELLSLRAIKTIALLIFTFLVAWGPYACVCILSVFGYQKHLTPWTTELPGLFAKTGALFNPIIYVFRHKRIRKRISRRYPRLQSFLSKQPHPSTLAHMKQNQTPSVRTTSKRSFSDGNLTTHSGTRSSDHSNLELERLRC
uniref:Opsin 3 n=1 Tax=Cryptocotyle lingua TaxID=66766 RepID=A0A7U0YEG5_9TREM|nr:opsin 3 [Cryptocotyle lingua]